MSRHSRLDSLIKSAVISEQFCLGKCTKIQKYIVLIKLTTPTFTRVIIMLLSDWGFQQTYLLGLKYKLLLKELVKETN